MLSHGVNLLSVRFNSGQSLLEIIVAVGVAVLLITGLVVGTSVSLRTSQYGQRRSQATKYAQEGIEILRSLRDSMDWDDFIALDTNGSGATSLCLGNDAVPVPGSNCESNLDTVFARQLLLEWNDADDRIELTVIVSWPEGGQTPDVALDTYFTQWR